MNCGQFNVLFLLCFVLGRFGVMSMTRQQMKNSGKILKKTCMPKNDVTEDQVGDIDKGKFIEEKNVMCYIACVYSMGQVIKNNKIVHEAMVKQVDMVFPPEMKDPVKATIEKCKPVGQVIVPDPNNVNKSSCCVENIRFKEFEYLHNTIGLSITIIAINSYLIWNHADTAKKYKDICEAAYWTAKCLYEADPANFMFA